MFQSATKLWIWMDVSAACNLACRDCYTKQSHEAYLMSVAQFRTILEKLADASVDLQRVHLNWRGEPTTNKRLTKFLELRKTILPNVDLEFHTNGLLLNASLCADIVDHAFERDLVYVSIDGGCQEAHEANRGPGTWDRTLQGLRMLLDARDKVIEGAPRIGIYEMFYGRQTRYDHELITLSRRCDEWSRVSPILLQGVEAMHDSGGIPTGPCFWAGNSFCITAKGEVHVCLLSFRPDGRLGNLFNESLISILEKARSFRADLITRGRVSIPHCQSCQKSAGEMDDD